MNITQLWGLDITNEFIDIGDEKIPISDLDGEIRMYLPLIYKRKFNCICSALKLDPKRTLMLLIDIFYLENPSSLVLLKTFISKRIEEGVDLVFLSSMKSIYFYLGHLLKKLKQI